MNFTTEMISFVAVAVAILSLFFSRSKDTKTDAATSAKLGAQLDSIQTGVDDIRVEVRTMRGRLDTLTERLAQCEVKIKNLEKEVFSK